MTSSVAPVDPDRLDDWLAEGGPAVLDLTFPDSENPRISRFVAELAFRYDGRVRVGVLDVSRALGVMLRFGVATVPTLLVLDDGELLALVAPTNLSRRRLLEILEPFLAE